MPDEPCGPATPKTKPWYLSKRMLSFAILVATRIVPMIWHDPTVKQICDWLLDAAGLSAGGLMLRDSGTRITMRDERTSAER